MSDIKVVKKRKVNLVCRRRKALNYAADILAKDMESQRKCLRCGSLFLSTHCGNRICKICSTENYY